MWRSPEPRPEYDAIIIGGGGHGLGAAYFLAKDHGITNVAVLEKGWLGGGNTGRNTMTVRSNFLREDSVPFHELSLDLYHQLSREQAVSRFESVLGLEFPRRPDDVSARADVSVLSLPPDHWWVRTDA